MTCLHVLNGQMLGREYKVCFHQLKKRWLHRCSKTDNYKVVDVLFDLIDNCLSFSKHDRPSAIECVTVLNSLCSGNKLEDQTIFEVIKDLGYRGM